MHTCQHCSRSFQSELQYELHADTCGEDRLLCRECGERFSEQSATRDGWHYRCPAEGCDGTGLTEDIVKVSDAKIASR